MTNREERGLRIARGVVAAVGAERSHGLTVLDFAARAMRKQKCSATRVATAWQRLDTMDSVLSSSLITLMATGDEDFYVRY